MFGHAMLRIELGTVCSERRPGFLSEKGLVDLPFLDTEDFRKLEGCQV